MIPPNRLLPADLVLFLTSIVSHWSLAGLIRRHVRTRGHHALEGFKGLINERSLSRTAFLH